ncbi:Flagellar hook-length control protein FliK [Brevundimonas diminuta]|uniref:flagellar hook-length control protein FliK n=1 Tax=Brevundimonas diminuta TaxID=293 RepID=UPI000D8C2B81|nr:flagellar hook-length control protein FliK [Brevundimonas diminuta]WQE46018.1 flagellar hook-length control protein FliK [Brevundimonas diminuta]SPU47220.1 Flagellar hook-length control protein FliK [Brevundimonas diminuta]SUW15254.1 Flagellar hook-length control protein FliK [Brevundimonas diminuta]
MSAVSLMSVLTPAAPGGASVDASVEAATDSAVFADLMLKEEAQAAPPVVQLVPVAQASETTAPIEAAPVEPAKDDIAVAPAPPAWFAPPPPVQQTAAPTAPADPTAPTTEATPVVAAAPSPAPSAVSEAVEAAPVAPTAEPAAATTATTATAAPVSAATPPPATISAALKAALPAVFAEPDAAPEPPSTESDEPSDAPPPSRPGAALPAQDAALLGVTGFRSGAGERLASAREAIQAAATATGNAEATANRPAQADAPIDAATSAPAARPAVAPALAETPAAAAVAAPPVDGEAPAAPQQGAVEAPSQAPGAQRDLGLSQLSRATVETTAQIAAQIVKKLDGRSTRFDMALTPEGLGRVDVSLEIESDGQVTARLAFDNPAAAADLRARADELRRQLLDAGLQLSRDDLEFAERDPSSGFGGGAFERQPDRRAFSGAARLAAEADSVVPPPSAWTSLSLTPDRVDLKV